MKKLFFFALLCLTAPKGLILAKADALLEEWHAIAMEEPPKLAAFKQKQRNLMQNAMRQLRTAMRRYKNCLAKQEGCSPEQQQLAIDAANVLLKLTLREAFIGVGVLERKK